MTRGLVVTIGIAAMLALASGRVMATENVSIGIAEEVENTVNGTLGEQQRLLGKDDEIFANEIITTDDDSTANLVFSDETELAVGPLSTIVLDKFVYNPDTRTGEIVFNATRGVFRFITGLGNKNIYTIKTPLATIGVQGTEFDLVIDEAGEAGVLLGNGEVRVCNIKRKCKSLHRQGHYLQMSRGKKWGDTRKWNGELDNVNLVTAFPYFAPRFDGRRMRPIHKLQQDVPGRRLFRQAQPRRKGASRQPGATGPHAKTRLKHRPRKK